MKKAFLFLALLSLPVCALAQRHRPSHSKALAITGVTVIDATGAPARPDSTVIIIGDRIAAIYKTGSARVPEGARVVSGAGKFLIPGLWDMHSHHQASGEESLPLFIASGVTGTRDMGSDLEFILDLRRRVAAGTTLGPRIVAAGPILDHAPAAWPLRLKVANETEAREAVRMLKRKGVDFLKVHARLPRDAYFAVADEAKKLGLSFAGHVPSSITFSEAVGAGQKSIEHLGEFGLLFECSSSSKTGVSLGEVVAAYSPEKCRALLERFKQAGTWHTPTLAMLQTYSKRPDEIGEGLRAKGYLKYVSPSLMKFWNLSEKLSEPPPEAVRGPLAGMFKKSVEVVGQMQREGVGLLAGCDALVPGLCLHDELELMVQAGLTPMQALQTATRNPALFLGKLETIGTIEEGKIADLVLLDADPLESISNTRKIAAVLVGGKLIDREGLNKMLAEVEAAASKR